jgi:hypothetical protein
MFHHIKNALERSPMLSDFEIALTLRRGEKRRPASQDNGQS